MLLFIKKKIVIYTYFFMIISVIFRFMLAVEDGIKSKLTLTLTSQRLVKKKMMFPGYIQKEIVVHVKFTHIIFLISACSC